MTLGERTRYRQRRGKLMNNISGNRALKSFIQYLKYYLLLHLLKELTEGGLGARRQAGRPRNLQHKEGTECLLV